MIKKVLVGGCVVLAGIVGLTTGIELMKHPILLTEKNLRKTNDKSKKFEMFDLKNEA